MSENSVMRRAQKTDRALVVEILVKSFYDNRSVNYIVKQDQYKSQRMKALMEYSFDLSLLFGEVWIDDSKAGCALILYPQKKRWTPYSMWLDLKVAIIAIGLLRVGIIARRERAIKRHQPKEDIAHLWFIGVDPKSQHQGVGSKLLLAIIDRSKAVRRPVYLETSVVQNVVWYKRFGFEVFETVELSYTLFLLRRNG